MAAPSRKSVSKAWASVLDGDGPEPAGTRNLLESPASAHITALACVVGFAVALAAEFAFTPREWRAPLLPVEASVAGFSVAVFAASISIQLINAFFDARESVRLQARVVIAVNGVALAADAIMLWLPTPIVLDPITGGRVHLTRWVEFGVLGVGQTWIVCALDSPSHALALRTALLTGLSTSCGFFFPLMPGPWSYAALMAFSFLTYFPIFARAAEKREAFDNLPADGLTAFAQRRVRATVALNMTRLCAVLWTTLPVAYFALWGVRHARQTARLEPDGLVAQLHFIVDTSINVILKLSYAHVLSGAHVTAASAAQGQSATALRDSMEVLWAQYGHVLLVSSRVSNTRAHTIASAGLAELIGEASAQPWIRGHAHGVQSTADDVDSISGPDCTGLGGAGASPSDALEAVVRRAWHAASTADGPCTVQCTLPGGPGGEGRPVEVHAGVAPNTALLVIALRDLTTKVALTQAREELEAERSASEQVIAQLAREKDADINRFTRHEVKNGMLAALGVCDALREMSERALAAGGARGAPAGGGGLSKGDGAGAGGAPGLTRQSSADETRQSSADERLASSMHRGLNEVTIGLQRTLNVVLAEAMAREVAHGAYTPQVEAVHLVELLRGALSSSSSAARFPILTQPEPLPQLELDPRLVFHIYRLALANACRWGQPGGLVFTELAHMHGRLTLRVINKPGPEHAQLVRLIDPTGMVFEDEQRLHSEAVALRTRPAGALQLQRGSSGSSAESDDGGSSQASSPGSSPRIGSRSATGVSHGNAWSMRECARALSGSCSISFEPDQTVFELVCPAPVRLPPEAVAAFAVPPGTVGIGIDDSRVQRAILGRIFGLLGVEKENTFVLGGTDEEMLGFADLVLQLVRRYPSRHFLIIADENLELAHAGSEMVSGSEALARVQAELEPSLHARLLLVVRSANDSADDTAVYLQRAHAVMPKRGFSKSAILEDASTLWRERFGAPKADEPSDSEDQIAVRQLERDIIDTVHSLLVSIDGALGADWPTLTKLLHHLKGELLSMPSDDEGSRFDRLVASIESVRRLDDKPSDLAAAWAALREAVCETLCRCADERDGGARASGERTPSAAATELHAMPTIRRSLEKAGITAVTPLWRALA